MTRPMIGFSTPVLTTWTPDLVQNAVDQPVAFAEYCQQTMGVPWPTGKDMQVLRKRIKEFFTQYPHTDYHTLCRVVTFLRTRKRRVPRVWMVVDEFRKAWAAGALPELDPGRARDDHLDTLIADALLTETDPQWRRRLLLAENPQAQREVYASWRLTLTH